MSRASKDKQDFDGQSEGEGTTSRRNDTKTVGLNRHVMFGETPRLGGVHGVSGWEGARDRAESLG